MKKIIAITFMLMVSITINAQQTATLTQVKGKDVYAVLLNKNEFKNVGNVELTQEQINSVSSIEEHIALFTKNVTVKYDALMTRDGSSAILMEYVDKTKAHQGEVTINKGKEIYFLSTPTKKYTVVDTKKLSLKEVRLPFSQIINNALSNESKPYDAVMIKNNKVEYLVFN